MKITETMRWALEQSLREAIERRGCKYGTTAYTAVVDNSIALCEKTNGVHGITESTLLAALRIACSNLDLERTRDVAITADEPECPHCHLVHEMPEWVQEYHNINCECGWRFQAERSKQIISTPLEYRK